MSTPISVHGFWRKAMVPILITIRARAPVQVSSFSEHSGEELIYAVRGRDIQVHTEFYEPTASRPARRCTSTAPCIMPH